MKDCNYDSRPFYDKLIEPLRTRARELGYALTVHGTLKRDIDLVAVPWATKDETEKPIAVPLQLAEALRRVAEEITGWAKIKIGEDDAFHRAGCPGMKAWGRLCWSFHLTEKWQGGGGPYIDLSILPLHPQYTTDQIVSMTKDAE